jgi:ATP-dependent Clp protease ATP-binding subunit ClpA
MDEKMATLVLDKNLRNIEKKLSKQKVTLTISDEVKKHLLSKGYSKEYGAREMERVVRYHLTKLLSKEILFGKLKKGGNAIITLENEKIVINKG